MDNELFELCKEVYEKTGLATETGHDGRELYLEKWYWTINGKVQSFAAERYKLLEDQVVAPLYTSDYLLEKLPKTIQAEYNPEYLTLYVSYPEVDDPKQWCACYEVSKPEKYEEYATTPLKALLKLTLALHEAGELK